MTQRSVTYLKGKFETNDVPTQSDYQDVFDSFLSLESSASQTISGSLVVPGIDATRVSAVTVSADTVHTSALRAVRIDANTVSAATVSADTVHTSALNAVRVNANTVSAATVSANTLRVNTKLVHSNQVVVPTGASQASALAVTLDVIFASAEQNERSIILPSLEPGRVNYVMNTGTTALLVFPPSGQNFVGSAANGSISLPTLTGCTIPHGVSAYGFIR